MAMCPPGPLFVVPVVGTRPVAFPLVWVVISVVMVLMPKLHRVQRSHVKIDSIRVGAVVQ